MAELTGKTAEEIRKLLAQKKIIIGAERTIKELKRGGIAKVYASQNCAPAAKADLAHYCKIAGIELVELPATSAELGILCKKPFSISVLGAVKAK